VCGDVMSTDDLYNENPELRDTSEVNEVHLYQ
jgi:hypothetical protein